MPVNSWSEKECRGKYSVNERGLMFIKRCIELKNANCLSKSELKKITSIELYIPVQENSSAKIQKIYTFELALKS